MKTLIGERELRAGIGRLADEIKRQYEGKPLTLVGVLTGSVMLLADLIRLLDMPVRVELLQGEEDPRGTRPGPPVINLGLLASNVRDRHVLLVDDIFATGRTLWELIPQIDELGPTSVRSVVLLQKLGRCEVALKPDFLGFEIPDAYVVGYGLDWRDRYRNLPYLAALEPGEMQEDAAR